MPFADSRSFPEATAAASFSGRSVIGVFLKSAGYKPEGIRFLQNVYPRFGHTIDQLHLAKESGRLTGENLVKKMAAVDKSIETDTTGTSASVKSI